MNMIKDCSSSSMEDKMKTLALVGEILPPNVQDAEEDVKEMCQDQSTIEKNVSGPQDDHSPMGWGGMNAPDHPVTEVNMCPGTQDGHSPMGWGGMKAPDQPATRNNAENDGERSCQKPPIDHSQNSGPGLQDGHSPMGWGGMNAPDQPAARNRAGSIVLGANACKEVLSSPALVEGWSTPKRKHSDDMDSGTRKRRASLVEHPSQASPELRATNRHRTMSLGSTPVRTRKTPKHRGSKKLNNVDPNQPLIRQVFSLQEKPVRGITEKDDNATGGT